MKKQNGGRWVKFEFKGEPKQEVFIAGTFNDWDPEKMRLRERGAGAYQTSLLLSSGRHEYKFVVNGNWCVDPNCPESVPNAHGSLNSVITVG